MFFLGDESISLGEIDSDVPNRGLLVLTCILIWFVNLTILRVLSRCCWVCLGRHFQKKLTKGGRQALAQELWSSWASHPLFCLWYRCEKALTTCSWSRRDTCHQAFAAQHLPKLSVKVSLCFPEFREVFQKPLNNSSEATHKCSIKYMSAKIVSSRGNMWKEILYIYRLIWVI